ncbi:MAG: SDR family NAD(P)-dependent oxidoreductase [Candidatus Sericytochromatia bacterium]
MSPSLSGQTIVITGASDGIGAYAAQALSRRGAHIAVVGRSPEKTRRVAENCGGRAFVCDFAQLTQVKALAQQLLDAYPQIDVLANNAGLIGHTREISADGHELTFQINHLAPFLLTLLLKERLESSRSRILNTSSIGNNMGYLDLDDLDSAKNYNAMRVYGTTKLENILFTRELARRWPSIQTAAFHPGAVATQFGHGGSPMVRLLYHTPLKHLLITPEKGCDTLFWLIDGSPGRDWISGGYYAKRKPGRMHRQAHDLDLARGLWERSLERVQGLL